jgi:cytochrome c oxidase cbb3-type subunit I
MHPFYVIRMTGGLLFLIAFCLMIYNVYMTITASEQAAPAAQPSLQPAE